MLSANANNFSLLREEEYNRKENFVCVKVTVSFRVGDNQTTAPKENSPLVRVVFGVDGGIFLVGNCSRTVVAVQSILLIPFTAKSCALKYRHQ